jgi:hypothetical protein
MLVQFVSVLAIAQTPDGQARASTFVSALAQAMSRRDRTAVADMVRYPFTATVGGVAIPVTGRGELVKLYESVFTAELRCLVDEAAASGAAALQIDAGGVSFAGRRIHASDVNGALKITRIDVPPVTGAGAPPNPPPRRVTIRKGDAQYAGRLYGDGVDTYVIPARRGDVIQARIEQFPGRSAAVRVVEQKTGKTLDRPGAAAPRVWNGTIQEAGDYRVEVVRLAPYCQPSFTYLLTITIK